ncbi:MAG: hypothetical protein PHE79_04730 [Eubacteriales bacterium]|nr:hypothetical protein [Eubacteriales bacterium]
MALNWTDKINNVDEVIAEDINAIAHAVIDAETDIIDIKADAADVYTAQEAVRKFAYLEEATGNSVQIEDTVQAPFAELEILGETQGLKVVFTATTVTTTGADFAFTDGATITFSGLTTTANNKSAVVTTVSGKTMTFPSATFTAATETVGSITDGTLTYVITVSPDNPQTLTSLTSFDYIAENADASETITKSISLKDTSDNQLTAYGIPATYNPDGSVATWAVQDKIVKGTDGKWYLKNNTKMYTFNGSTSWNAGLTNVGATHSRFWLTNGQITNPLGFLASVNCISTKTSQNLGSYIRDNNVNGVYTYTSGCALKLANALTGVLGTDSAADAIVKLTTYLTSNPITMIYYSSAVDTELCTSDQTALNEAEAAGTFDGLTNIMLSSELGQVYVKAAKNITKVIDDIKAAIALLG